MTEELNKPAASAALAPVKPAVVAMPEDYAHQGAYGEYLAWVNTAEEQRPIRKEFLEALHVKYELPWDLIRGWQIGLFAAWHFNRVPAYQTDFAAKIGVSQQALCDWHKDERLISLVQRLRLISFIQDAPGIDRAMVKRAMKGDVPAARLIYDQMSVLAPPPPAPVSATQVNVNVSGSAQIGVEHWEALPPQRPAGEFYEGEVADDPPAEKPEDVP